MPGFGAMTGLSLPDAHVHLQDPRFLGGPERVLKRARALLISPFVCCGTHPRDWDQVEDLARKHDDVIPSLGLHPWFLHECPGWEQALHQRIRQSTAWVGEFGLDRGFSGRDDALQKQVFEAQYRMALELARVASIHCRKAWGELRATLEAFGPNPRGFILHSYAGSAEMVPVFASLGAYFSFSGAITFPGRHRLQKAAKAVPAHRLLVESDAPDMHPYRDPPVPRETLNEPANVVEIAHELARLRDEKPSQLATQIQLNFQQLRTGGPA